MYTAYCNFAWSDVRKKGSKINVVLYVFLLEWASYYST